MIELHMINDTTIVLNSDMIEFIEATPDTIISLSNGKKMMVKEPVSVVVDKIVEFRTRLIKPAQELVRQSNDLTD